MLDIELVRCGAGCVPTSSTAFLTLILPIILSLSCLVSDYLMKIENSWCLLWACMESRMEKAHSHGDTWTRLLADCYKTLYHITLATQRVPMCLITPYHRIKIHYNGSTTLEEEWGKGHYYSKVLKCLAILTPFLQASLPQLPFSYIQLYIFSASSVRTITEEL